jgi:hypothetical protein
MGMFNEVNKRCPECGTSCQIQIYELVPGFGEFDLDDDANGHLKDLTMEEKIELKECIEEKQFVCASCSNCFTLQVVILTEKNTNRVVI